MINELIEFTLDIINDAAEFLLALWSGRRKRAG